MQYPCSVKHDKVNLWSHIVPLFMVVNKWSMTTLRHNVHYLYMYKTVRSSKVHPIKSMDTEGHKYTCIHWVEYQMGVNVVWKSTCLNFEAKNQKRCLGVLMGLCCEHTVDYKKYFKKLITQFAL